MVSICVHGINKLSFPSSLYEAESDFFWNTSFLLSDFINGIFFFSIKGWEDPLHIRKQTDLFNNFCCAPVSACQVLGTELHSWQPTLCSPRLRWDTGLLTLDIRWCSQLMDGTQSTTLSNAHRVDGGRIRQTHSIFFFEMTCGWPLNPTTLHLTQEQCAFHYCFVIAI